MSVCRNDSGIADADVAVRPGCLPLNAALAETMVSGSQTACRLLATEKAAELLGMGRRDFGVLAGLLNLEAIEKPGRHGGKPGKLYARRDVTLVTALLERCAKEGGRAVLICLLGAQE